MPDSFNVTHRDAIIAATAQHGLPYFVSIGLRAAYLHCHAHTADDPAGPPLAQLEHRTHMSDGLSLGSGRHHFFPSNSFNAALSSMASASSFFSLAFSLSSPFSRFASETSRPPYWLSSCKSTPR